ncbi:MAG: alpha-amylase family glycosyl hydrolase, partial [bacterium]|nr:alpha-amylase family glycosyl hydrolase [bacterium]
MDKINFSTSMRPKIAFKGHSLVTNPNGKKEYQFYLPTTQDVKPEVVIFDKDGKKTDVSDKLTKHENTTIPVWSLPVSETKGQTVGYVFNTSDGKKIHDKTRYTLDGQYNEAIKSDRATHEMGKQMYHLMPDSFARKDGILKDENGKEVERNHVNKFGGKIEDIEAKLPEIKELGAKKIISTPIYGNDTLSNHGYWTQNPYQITSTLGDINSFKKLQTSLFKNGLGFVADGAFANEGLNGIHMQDLIRWGEQSPYMNWFDTKDFDSYGFKFGVLPPKGSEAEKHYDFKLINSPVVYKFNEDGTPVKDFGKANPNYKPSEATYVQLFDRRLMDKNYINTEDKATEYTKKQTNNTYDIKNYKDSVQLLTFQVSPNTAKNKVKELAKFDVKEAPETHSPFRNKMKEWDNFAFNTVDKDATIRNWTGKKDIVALNYRNQDVQNYIINTVKYWTNETDKILTTTIAKEIAKADNKAELIKEYAKRYDAKITDEEINNILNNNDENKLYEVALVQAKDNIKDELKDFPLLAAELPVEVQSLLSDKNVIGSKSFDKAYENIEKVVTEIFAAQHPEAIKDGKLNKEGSQLFRLASSDVMRYVSAYALSGEKPAIEFDEETNTTFIKKSENFNSKVLNNINYENGSRNQVIEKLEIAFENGVKKLANDKEAQEDLATIIKNSTENINKKDIEIAKSIITKLELGLDHRVDALKDIRDLDLITQNIVNENDVWATVEDFFKNFSDTIRAINPKSYIIGEITCLGNYIGRKASGDEQIAKEHNAISNTGVTTQTNYTYIFNILNQIVHGAPEDAFGNQSHKAIGNTMEQIAAGKADNYCLNAQLEKFFNSGYADNIRYSHEGFGNHDKPRALHGFAIDINNFFYPKNLNNH